MWSDLKPLLEAEDSGGDGVPECGSNLSDFSSAGFLALYPSQITDKISEAFS